MIFSKFDLQSSLDLPHNGFLERVIPGRTPAFTLWEHAARYRFIRRYVSGRRVLDAGCGDGYGTYYLSQYAGSAVGIDVSRQALAEAPKRYSSDKAHYLAMDCRALAFPHGSFDVVCSFEVIEHIAHLDGFLADVNRVLTDGGVFVVSTPNSARTSGQNPFHVREYTFQEFAHILSPHFSDLQIYGQFCNRPLREYIFNVSYKLWLRSRSYRRFILSLAPLYFRGVRSADAARDPDWIEKVGPNSFAFRRNGAEAAHYLVAVCSKRLP